MRRLFAFTIAICLICVLFLAACTPKEKELLAFNVETELANAERLLLEGNYEEVILTLETVLEVEPANVRGYLMLADTYIARGEEEKALALLQKGLDLTGDEEIAVRIQGMTEELTDIVDVSSGGSTETTLLLTREGELYYCGEANLGNKIERSLVPKRIEGASNIKKLIASEGGCYYLTHDDELYGWGWCEAPDRSGYNRVGSDYSKPRKIMDDVLDIATAYSQCGLVLKTDHTLYSWGNNEDGQLGRGLPYDETEYEIGDWTPDYDYYGAEEIVLTDVVDMDIVGISGNGTTACAVTADGGLYIWGRVGYTEEDGVQEKKCYNSPQRIFEGMIKACIYDNGILGIDRNGLLVKLEWYAGDPEDLQVSLCFTDAAGQAKIVQVSSWDMDEMATAGLGGMAAVKVTDIDCGEWHFLALGTDGTVYTGGHNENGQLGIAEDSYIDESTLYTPLQEKKAVMIDAQTDGSSSFAILETGRLLAWGDNRVGQLGNGRSGEQRDDAQRHLILRNVKEIIAITNQAYAIMENDDLYAWGYDFYGKWKADGEEIVKSPKKIFEDVKTVALGGTNSLVLTNDGTVYSSYPIGEYGADRFIGIANGQFERHKKYSDFYKLLEGVKDIHSINGSYFILYENGELWGWGDNYNCLLGIGTKTDSSLTADQYIYEPVLIMEDVADVTGSTYILKKNGDLYYCGYGFPEYVLWPEHFLSDVDKLFDSGWHSVYYLSDGALHYYDCASDDRWTGKIDIPETVVDMGFSNDRGLFIDDENRLYETIYYTQYNIDGTSKDGYDLFRPAGKYTPPEEYGYYYRRIAEDAKSCASTFNSDGTFYYVTLDGDLYSWGSNNYGLLGIGDARQDENIFEVKLPE